MKKYSIINFLMVQSMMISGMGHLLEDYQVEKMEMLRRIRNRETIKKRKTIGMESGTSSGDDMSLERSASLSKSSSGSFSSLPIPIPQKSAVK
jgi:hypothetical protein